MDFFIIEVKLWLGSLPDKNLKDIAYGNIEPGSDYADPELVENKSRRELIDILAEIIVSWDDSIESTREWMKEYYDEEVIK